jgi:hypothetical protein
MPARRITTKASRSQRRLSPGYRSTRAFFSVREPADWPPEDFLERNLGSDTLTVLGKSQGGWRSNYAAGSRNSVKIR